jgi:hypothetical protein
VRGSLVRRAGAVLMVVGTLAAVVACSSGAGPFASTAGSLSSEAGALWHPEAGLNRIRVTVQRGCPAAVGYATEVSNPGSGLTATLVPAEVRPTRGLVCVYPEPRSYPTPRPPMRPVIALDESSAVRLADLLAKVSPQPSPTWTASCPGGPDNITVIVLSYVGRADLDLRYDAFGCRAIDNGYVGAFQAANIPFANFQEALDSWCPTPTDRRSTSQGERGRRCAASLR